MRVFVDVTLQKLKVYAATWNDERERERLESFLRDNGALTVPMSIPAALGAANAMSAVQRAEVLAYMRKHNRKPNREN
jgi:hypothetical protein